MGAAEAINTLAQRLRRARDWLLSNPPLVENSFEAVGVLLFFSLVLLFALKPISSFDPWWHLSTGRWIFAHHQVPRVDPFSHTCPGCRWIDLCWLFQVLAWLSYRAGGYLGFWLLKAALVVATMAVLYLVVRRHSYNRYTAVALSITGLLIVQMRFLDRPHLLGFLCLLLFVEAARAWTENESLLGLASAVVIYLVWLNSHGSFLMAFAVAGALFLGDAQAHLGISMGELVRQRWLHRHLTLMGLIGLSSLATPYGYKMLTFALLSHIGKGADATRNIAEWHPMQWRGLFNLIPGKIEALRGLLFLGSALAAACCWRRFRRESVAMGVLLVFSLALSLRHLRFVAIGALLLLPWLAVLISQSGKKVQWAVVMLMAIYTAPLIAKAFELPRITGDYARPVSSRYPWEITAFVKEHRLKGNMMNPYAMGGFLIWRLYPGCRVYIDGRTPTVYSPFQFWVYRQVDRYRHVLFHEIEKDGIRLALVKRGSKPARWLWDNSTWCLADMDDTFALYVKNATAKAAGVQCFRQLKPFAGIGALVNKNNSTMLMEEAERLTALSPRSTWPHRLLARILEDNGNRTAALAEVKKALAIHPRSLSLHFRLAVMLMEDNETSMAMNEMRQVLSLNPKATPAIERLGILCYQAGRYQKAVHYLQRYLSMVGDGTMRTYSFLGLAQYELLYVKDALDSFKKALALATKDKLRKVYYNYIGNCYWGTGNYKKAIESYRLALKIDPGYQDARKNLEMVLKIARGEKPTAWSPWAGVGARRQIEKLK